MPYIALCERRRRPPDSTGIDVGINKIVAQMKYMLIAGEASGDLHASNLINSLKKLIRMLISVFRRGSHGESRT